MIYVVGCGPSLKGFDFGYLKNKKTIAVNNTWKYIPNPDYYITMDYMQVNKYGLPENTPKFFIANLANVNLIEKNGCFFHKATKEVYDLSKFDVIIKSYKTDGVGYTFNDFRSGNNSGFCGIQLAILLGYKKINLLGFDMDVSKTTHFYNNERYVGLDTKYSQYRKHLKSVLWKIPEDVSINRHSLA